MNDPNGLVFYRGQWHLFYQWQPAEASGKWWGHAVSGDLVNWRHLPAALCEDEHGAIWSGSVVVDERDSSGFFNGGEGLVAIFTHQKAEYQAQSLAFSSDGLAWTKFEGNPVLRSENPNFRDPKVFWHEQTQRWTMVLATGDCLSFFTSPNLREWTPASTFGTDTDAPGDVWECPDLFPLAIDGDANRKKWVLLASRLGLDNFEDYEDGERGFGVCATYYFVGDFDGSTFISESDPLPLGGPDDYASVSWSNAPGGRRILIGWMNHWGYAELIPTPGYQGALTLPREVALRTLPEGVRLVQNPLRALETLRDAASSSGPLFLQSDEIVPVNGGSEHCEVLCEMEPEAGGASGLLVRAGDEEATIIGYDTEAQCLFLDRSQAGDSDFSDHFARRYEVPLRLQRGLLRLRVLIDSTSVEVFANGGQARFCALIFPAPGNCGIEIFSEDAGCRVRSLTIYQLKAARFDNPS